MFKIIELAIADGALVDLPYIDMTINSTFRSINDEGGSYMSHYNIQIVDHDGKEKYDKNIYRDIILLLKIFEVPSKNRIMEIIKTNKHYTNLLLCHPELA